MRLSEAIVLGSTQIELDGDQWLEDGRGCLLGMGFHALTGEKSAWLPDIVKRWRWLDVTFVDVPAHFSSLGVARFKVGAIIAISRVARYVEHGHITFEQAIDWIRSIEPAEENQNEQPKENATIEHCDNAALV